jgi:predicted dehydrogenase
MADPPQPALRIGALGAAAITPAALIRPARDVEGVAVVAVAARDRNRAASFAAKHAVPVVHDSYDALLADPDIDAVYNPLPNSLHASYSIAALEAGKHVLCEKPFAANAAEAREVARVAEPTGLVVMEAFHYRYHPLMQRAVDVAQGELGTLRHVESWMQVPLIKPGDIRYDLGLAGGATMDLGCYSIHQLRSLSGGEPTVQSARAKEHRPGVDRFMQAELRFESGVSGRFTCSLYGAVPLRIGFRAVGDDGELRVFNPAGPHLYHRFTVRSPTGGKRRERFPKVPTYRYQLEAFRDAVTEGRPILTPPSDSIANMEVIDAVYRSAGLDPRGTTSAR